MRRPRPPGRSSTIGRIAGAAGEPSATSIRRPFGRGVRLRRYIGAPAAWVTALVISSDTTSSASVRNASSPHECRVATRARRAVRADQRSAGIRNVTRRCRTRPPALCCAPPGTQRHPRQPMILVTAGAYRLFVQSSLDPPGRPRPRRVRAALVTAGAYRLFVQSSLDPPGRPRPRRVRAASGDRVSGGGVGGGGFDGFVGVVVVVADLDLAGLGL